VPFSRGCPWPSIGQCWPSARSTSAAVALGHVAGALWWTMAGLGGVFENGSRISLFLCVDLDRVHGGGGNACI
jgi:hypothetical protein